MDEDVTFTTDNHYNGPLSNQRRMHGFGVFTFTTGTRYEGNFKDGMFHGKGTLYFPDGGKFKSSWEEGKCVGPESTEVDSGSTESEYTFSDGLKYKSMDWNYCSMEDRRFHSERCKEILPAGRMQLTDKPEDILIPLGWYDCGDGLYNPNKRIVYTYKGNRFLRNADTEEHEWIVNTCRKGVNDEEQLDPITRLYKINS